MIPDGLSDDDLRLWNAMLDGLEKSMQSPKQDVRQWAVEKFLEIKDKLEERCGQILKHN